MTHPPRRPLHSGLTGLALATALALTGCGGDASQPGDADENLQVVASFYPLEYVAERVGGERVTVTNLTKPGAEPHDLELAPLDLGTLSEADLALYLGGFQPAVDAAVDQAAPSDALDVSAAADLSLTSVDDHAHEGDEQVADPHFWLDPMRLADVADEVAASLGEIDPAAQATFEANAADLRADLQELDQDFRSGLRNCERQDVVTSHKAFGYLANAYDLDQVGISGLTPETEPNPQDLADVTEFVDQNEVTTIFYETLVSPDVAATIADATGADTDVLDPIEGLSDSSQGDDYVEIMRSNLANLQAGLSCR